MHSYNIKSLKKIKYVISITERRNEFQLKSRFCICIYNSKSHINNI